MTHEAKERRVPARGHQKGQGQESISYLLRILRAHGILHKVPKSHRYKVSPKGRDLLVAVLTAHHASIEKLTRLAA